MEAGLYLALENQVVHGDGTGENLTGLLNTSGIIVQAFATDALTSIRKAMTSLEVYGITPTALVLNPVDAEPLDLPRDSGATGRYLLGDPGGDGVEKLWKVPRVPSIAVPAGTAVLGDWQQAQVIVREDATLALDRSAENFTKNLVTVRLEGPLRLHGKAAQRVCRSSAGCLGHRARRQPHPAPAFPMLFTVTREGWERSNPFLR